MMRSRANLVRVAGALATGSLLLAGCAAAVPEPDPEPTPDGPFPALTVPQGAAVLDAVGEALAAADGARDPAQLEGRLADPAKSLRAAQYTLAERSQGQRTPTPLTTNEQVLVVAATEGWPRTFVAVTEPAEGSTAPLLLTLRQPDARSPYRLISWARLFPGAEVPSMAGPEVGSPQLGADADGLVVTPAEALARYADVLTNGSASQHADSFIPDPYVAQQQAEIKTGRDSLQGIAEITVNAAVDGGATVVLETADGGALVIGKITTTTGYRKTLAGSTLRLGGEAGAWLGDGTVPSLANVRHDSLVAFYVPPAETEAKIVPLGAERVLVDASRV